MKRIWVVSKSGIQHLTIGSVYLCNESLLHTKFYVKYNKKKVACAKCLEKLTGEPRSLIVDERNNRRRKQK